MKTLIFIVLLVLSEKLSAQEFEIKQPNLDKIQSQLESEPNQEPFYFYLTNNYKPTSEKYEVEYYDWNSSEICSFSQDFENNIRYTIWQCKEAGGISVEIQLPHVLRENLMPLIESLDNIENFPVEPNVWKENNSKYEPSETVPGCYYEIENNEPGVRLKIYCGC